MRTEEERLQTFVEKVLTLLEERFLWLGSGRDEAIEGARTIDEPSDSYRSLIRARDQARREDADSEA